MHRVQHVIGAYRLYEKLNTWQQQTADIAKQQAKQTQTVLFLIATSDAKPRLTVELVSLVSMGCSQLSSLFSTIHS